jgi:hypothetical protein
MKSQDEITLLIAKRDQGKAQNARFVHTDNIVGMLGEFPELTKAVRERDVATVSILCSQLLDSNSVAKVRPPQARRNPTA